MRIVTWNLNNAGAASKREARVWQHLLSELKPDVALLQEARLPGSAKSSIEALADADGTVLSAGASSRGWGSAVYVRSGAIHELPSAGFEGKPGYCIAVEYRQAGGSAFAFASLHAPTVPTVFPRLDDCIRDLETRYAASHLLVMGGDLNTARVAERRWPGYGHGRFWNGVDGGRLFDCHYALHGRETNTLVRKKKEMNIQDDHVLIRHDLGRHVVRVFVPDEESFRALDLSDHLPLVVDFDEQFGLDPSK